MSIILGILGSLILIIGILIYRAVSQMIGQGEQPWGLGWLFHSMTQGEASFVQAGSIVGIIVGAILIIIAFLLLKRRKTE